jgi:lysophospholipase L1-like esterase
METIRAANAAAKALADADPLLEYVDVEAALLGADGKPRPNFYAENGLNLNDEGYAAWNAAVRPVIEKNWPGASPRK